MTERKQTTEATDAPPKADAVGSQVDQVVRPLALTARTQKAKSRLRELALVAPSWDGTWRERDRLPAVSFAPGKKGPWLYVAPFGVDGRTADMHARWVHESLDEHFGVAAA